MMKSKTVEPKVFEESLADLEGIVANLERGDLKLEDALSAFEKGVELTRVCQQILDAAELKIQQLSQPSEGAPLEPFAD